MTSTEVTPLVLTFNEAPNIRRTLAKLAWAREILVVDSFSTDATVELVRQFPQARVVQRKFDTHAQQWQAGVDECRSDWVLALDADYVLSEELVAQVKSFVPVWEVAYAARFVYCIGGRPLRGTLYRHHPVLFRKDACRFVQDGHTQDLVVQGPTGWLQGVIYHDDRKPLARWFASQAKYVALEAEHLLRTPANQIKRVDRLRQTMVLGPPLVLFYTLFAKRLILDGWAGWYYAFQRTLAELMLSLELMEVKLEARSAERQAEKLKGATSSGTRATRPGGIADL